jgi:hypothetical protein
MARLCDVVGFCPACGEPSLHILEGAGILHCTTADCPRPDTAHLVLAEREIHHIVRFNQEGWAAKHPLRERVGGELLDCSVMGVVQAVVNNGQIYAGYGREPRSYSDDRWHPVEGTWRLRFEPTWLEDPEFGGDPFSWERLDESA